MSQPRFPCRIAFNTQRGLTLVELLVSITIGLLVTVAAASVYLVARQGFSTSDDQTRAFQTGRLVVDQLSRNLRMAGAPFFNPEDLNVDTGGIVPVPADAIVGVEGGDEPDAISIAYANVDPYSPTTLMGADCQGQQIGAGAGAGEVVVNSFFVVKLPLGPSGSLSSVLACRGNGPAAVTTAGATVAGLTAAMAAAGWEPIADQVVDMQVMYGMASAASPGSAVRSVDANGVMGAGGWSFVRTADICIEVVSQANRALKGAMPGLNCRGTAFSPDGHLHRLFRFTVNRRNETVGNIFAGSP